MILTPHRCETLREFWAKGDVVPVAPVNISVTAPDGATATDIALDSFVPPSEETPLPAEPNKFPCMAHVIQLASGVLVNSWCLP